MWTAGTLPDTVALSSAGRGIGRVTQVGETHIGLGCSEISSHVVRTSGVGKGALLGTIAKSAASVAENRDGDAVVFEPVTGVPR